MLLSDTLIRLGLSLPAHEGVQRRAHDLAALKASPEHVGELTRFHATLKVARGVVEGHKREEMLSVSASGLKSILGQIQDLEEQVNAMLGSLQTGKSNPSGNAKGVKSPAGAAQASQLTVSESLTPAATSGAASKPSAAKDSSSSASGAVDDDECAPENLLYSLGAGSLQSRSDVSIHPLFSRNTNCTLDSVAEQGQRLHHVSSNAASSPSAKQPAAANGGSSVVAAAAADASAGSEPEGSSSSAADAKSEDSSPQSSAPVAVSAPVDTAVSLGGVKLSVQTPDAAPAPTSHAEGAIFKESELSTLSTITLTSTSRSTKTVTVTHTSTVSITKSRQSAMRAGAQTGSQNVASASVASAASAASPSDSASAPADTKSGSDASNQKKFSNGTMKVSSMAGGNLDYASKLAPLETNDASTPLSMASLSATEDLNSATSGLESVSGISVTPVASPLETLPLLRETMNDDASTPISSDVSGATSDLTSATSDGVEASETPATANVKAASDLSLESVDAGLTSTAALKSPTQDTPTSADAVASVDESSAPVSKQAPFSNSTVLAARSLKGQPQLKNPPEVTSRPLSKNLLHVFNDAAKKTGSQSRSSGFKTITRSRN